MLKRIDDHFENTKTTLQMIQYSPKFAKIFCVVCKLYITSNRFVGHLSTIEPLFFYGYVGAT